MAHSSPFLQARHAKIANLICWAAFAALDVYLVATHYRSLTVIRWITAVLAFVAALNWMRLMAQSLRAGDNE